MNLGYVSPEDFQVFKTMDAESVCSSRSSKYENASSSTTMILIIIVAIVLLYVFSGSCKNQLHQFRNGISVMFSKFNKRPPSTATAVSSKQSDIKTLDAYVKQVHAKCENLTACLKGDASCEDFKNVSTEYKARTTKHTHDYLDTNKNIIMLIYAPWCPHCHTALPAFMEMAEDTGDASVKIAILNAEMVDRSVLGEIGVTHFPFIASSQNGMKSSQKHVFKGAPTKENLVQFYKDSLKKENAELDSMFAA